MYMLLAPTKVEENWMEIAPWIAQAITGARISEELESVKQRALAGGMQIWIGMKPRSNQITMVFVTEGFMLEGSPVLVLRMMAGVNVDECLPDLAILERWAINQGFHTLEVWGREGWKRKLRPLGFHYEYTILRKVLDKGLH